ncbi:hypothetical protein ASPTUDRAFT_771178 [Aspergillus tubingensis CBS 134.48]|uniref:Uncharacterized protein n=1 Tax=Aspergillus tubingensis (strain CBS 134.48) TaxID=767770 RepID=A0A1L9MZP2_ASPTC|nr:hypothetical protein ASPTUDRAFT_771178 [Aspergillus tubingensis CBS 134.48]
MALNPFLFVVQGVNSQYHRPRPWPGGLAWIPHPVMCGFAFSFSLFLLTLVSGRLIARESHNPFQFVLGFVFHSIDGRDPGRSHLLFLRTFYSTQVYFHGLDN